MGQSRLLQEVRRHLENVRREVDAMAKHFSPRAVVDIGGADLRAWYFHRITRKDQAGELVLDEKGERVLLAEKTRNGVRSVLDEGRGRAQRAVFRGG